MKKILSKIDIYGSSYNFRVNNELEYRTKTGTAITFIGSLIFVVVILIWLAAPPVTFEFTFSQRISDISTNTTFQTENYPDDSIYLWVFLAKTDKNLTIEGLNNYTNSEGVDWIQIDQDNLHKYVKYSGIYGEFTNVTSGSSGNPPKSVGKAYQILLEDASDDEFALYQKICYTNNKAILKFRPLIMRKNPFQEIPGSFWPMDFRRIGFEYCNSSNPDCDTVSLASSKVYIIVMSQEYRGDANLAAKYTYSNVDPDDLKDQEIRLGQRRNLLEIPRPGSLPSVGLFEMIEIRYFYIKAFRSHWENMKPILTGRWLKLGGVYPNSFASSSGLSLFFRRSFEYDSYSFFEKYIETNKKLAGLISLISISIVTFYGAYNMRRLELDTMREMVKVRDETKPACEVPHYGIFRFYKKNPIYMLYSFFDFRIFWGSEKNSKSKKKPKNEKAPKALEGGKGPGERGDGEEDARMLSMVAGDEYQKFEFEEEKKAEEKVSQEEEDEKTQNRILNATEDAFHHFIDLSKTFVNEICLEAKIDLLHDRMSSVISRDELEKLLMAASLGNRLKSMGKRKTIQDVSQLHEMVRKDQEEGEGSDLN